MGSYSFRLIDEDKHNNKIKDQLSAAQGAELIFLLNNYFSGCC